MRIDSSPTPPSTRSIISNTSSNGNKKDSTDQSPSTSTLKVTSTTLNWNLKKSINTSPTDWATQNSWVHQLTDCSSSKTTSSTQLISTNLSSNNQTPSQTHNSTSNKEKSFMKTPESSNGSDSPNWQVWVSVLISPFTFHSVWDSRPTWSLMLLMKWSTSNTICAAPPPSTSWDSASQSEWAPLPTLFMVFWTTPTLLPTNTSSRWVTQKTRYVFVLLEGTRFRQESRLARCHLRGGLRNRPSRNRPTSPKERCCWLELLRRRRYLESYRPQLWQILVVVQRQEPLELQPERRVLPEGTSFPNQRLWTCGTRATTDTTEPNNKKWTETGENKPTTDSHKKNCQVCD